MWFTVCLCSAYIPLNNYMVFNDVDGLYTYTFEAERKVCPWISSGPLISASVMNFKHTFNVHLWCRKTVRPAAKFLWTCTFPLLPNSRRCWTTWLRVPPCRFSCLMMMYYLLLHRAPPYSTSPFGYICLLLDYTWPSTTKLYCVFFQTNEITCYNRNSGRKEQNIIFTGN